MLMSGEAAITRSGFASERGHRLAPRIKAQALFDDACVIGGDSQATQMIASLEAP